jgi:tRNA pseudouridine(38-40) synthase
MRFEITFGFDGQSYYGSQKQIVKKTIQGELEEVLSVFFQNKVDVVFSGRTDAGVSAMKQIAHFDIIEDKFLSIIPSTTDKDLRSLVIRLNYMLDENIRIYNISKVSDDFHARYDAKEKTYIYNFYVSEIENPYLSRFCLWVKGRDFDIDKVKRAVNEINRRMTLNMYVSLNEFYSEIGLKTTEIGDDLGWNLDHGLIKINYSSALTEYDEPCLVLNYNVSPQYDYYKLVK